MVHHSLELERRAGLVDLSVLKHIGVKFVVVGEDALAFLVFATHEEFVIFQRPPLKAGVSLIIGQYLFKILLAALDTPFVYAVVRVIR